jgi:SecD/SecF fusion protein
VRARLDSLGLATTDVTVADGRITVPLPEGSRTAELGAQLTERGGLEVRPVLAVVTPGTPGTAGAPGCVPQRIQPRGHVVLCERSSLPLDERLRYRLGATVLSGRHVESAEAGGDGDAATVAVRFDREGERLFTALTAELACEPDAAPSRRVALVVRGEVVAAPKMGPDVRCGEGVSRGTADIPLESPEEARELAALLVTELPLALRVADER